MKKYFAVSDIHSFYCALREALDKKGFDESNPNHIVIVCGDAFDRGDYSKSVFEFLKTLKVQNRLVYIRGNHEDLLFECIDELRTFKACRPHHYSNGTVSTLSHFLAGDDYWAHSAIIPDNIVEDILINTKELCEFIDDTCINYFELGNKIFVHSWLPTDEYSKLDSTELRDSWSSARWGNPFQLWQQGFYPKDKCIVFGHWHTSWYWAHIKQELKEWPPKNHSNWPESFKPAIEDNIIGLDACTAYSGFVNCVVFDENGNIIEGE